MDGEGTVCGETEIDSVGIAVVPPATYAAEATQLMTADGLNLCSHKLLSLAEVGHSVFAQKVGGIDKQRGLCALWVVDAIMGTALAGGNLCADAVGIVSSIIA